MLCAKRGKCASTLYEQKIPAWIQILRAYIDGDRGCRNPTPRGYCGNPGICFKCAQGQKSLKGLPRATHCTDLAQTSGNVSPTVELCPPHPTFRTKVRARRDAPEGKKKSQLYIYIFHFVYMALVSYYCRVQLVTTAVCSVQTNSRGFYENIPSLSFTCRISRRIKKKKENPEHRDMVPLFFLSSGRVRPIMPAWFLA